jgi:hypothetical protein
MTPDSHWTGILLVPTGPGDCREPAVTVAGEVLHAVWTQGSNLYHAYLAGGSWSVVNRVATGSQAALAAAPDGGVHCLFSAQMLGNVEIYHTTWKEAKWALPEVVSRTSGVSLSPALAIGEDGSLHAAWSDTTPGYATIYYGRCVEAGWTSGPIPNGSGSHPVIAVDPVGQIYVAWQSRSPATDRFEVFCAQNTQGAWSLPADVSANNQTHAIYPSLAITAQSICHLVWQEDRGGLFCIRHADRYPNGWSENCDLTQSDADCRLPHVCTNRQGYPQAVWAEGQVVTHRVRPPERNADWWQVESACDPSGAVSALAAAISGKGVMHLVWAAYAEGETRRLQHAHREPVFKPAVFMPMVSRDVGAEPAS